MWDTITYEYKLNSLYYIALPLRVEFDSMMNSNTVCMGKEILLAKAYLSKCVFCPSRSRI